ncbi:MAG TPA: hypothetical protein PLG20_08220, partial [Candidatus Syntrophosphaera sp.]|nr:hypothetical protein [Candidatus Syntrophosphaera sp.]
HRTSCFGIEGQQGGILGIWGAKTLNGTYVNATGATSENVNLYHYSYDPGYADPTDHFAFGNVTATDDLAGHTTVSGADSLTYLDRQYLGKLSLDYRGVYYLPQGSPLENGASYAYDSVGTGIYKLDRLAWSGDWGQNRYAYHLPVSLYANIYDPENQYSFMEPIAHDMGLAGGTTPFWTGTSRLTALGYLTDGDYSISGEAVAEPLLWNSGIGAQALTGSTVDDVFIPDAKFTGVTAGIWKDGLMNGSAYAIYKTAAGQAGWLIGKDTLSGLYNSDLGVWKTEGDLTPTQRIAQLPAEVTSDDLDVFHDIAIGMLGGNFANGVGNIQNQSSILQTTFYGKGLYDEEGYLNEVIPLRWGIYDVRMAYGNSFSGKTSVAPSWTSKIGGYGPTQMNAPFFYLADITGTWKADGTIDGQLSGTYMTPLYLGVLSGPFYGLYTEETTDNGTWQAMGIGSFEVTQTLAFSSVFSGSTYKTAKGTLNINSYAMPGFNSNMGIFQGVDYETAYFRADSDTSGSLVKYGWQWENVRIRYDHQRGDLIYYPNDSLQSFMLVNGVPVEVQGSTSALSSAWGFWPDLHQSPPASPIVKNNNFIIVNDEFPFTGPLVVNPTNMEFAKIFSQQVDNWYTTVRLIPDPANPLAPTFEGIMGGYTKDGDSGRTLWTSTVENPMGISFMGEHAGFEGPAAMSTGIGSSYNGTNTTPDDGAYFGFFTNNVSADRSTRGMFYGFYISPEGEAGFLKSTNIAGMSYAGLNMWEADGDIYSEVLGNISMPASDLMTNVQLGAMSGNIQYGGTGGNFVSGGYLKHWAMDNGYTASIKGHSSNGIFIKASSAGEYSNPEGSSTWQADFAGYGTFGNFGDAGQPGAFSDYGIWHLNAGGAAASWANNQIYAPVTGEFLTYTKKGELAGTFLGNYSGTESGIWGGTTSGVYQKTANVAFSSGMAGKVFANKLTKSISGFNYGTQYWIDGDPANFPNERLYVQKTSCADGACTATQYGDYGYVDEANPVAYTKTTWQYNATAGSITGQTLLESVTISDVDYLAEVNAMRAGAQEYTGWSLNNKNFQGVFAGFNSDSNNLWYNMANGQPTSIELAGLYSDAKGSQAPGIMTTGLASFNPFNAMDPLVNSESPIGGAYYAYMGAAFGKHQVASDLFDGLISGLYLNPDGKAGILYGSIGGYNQPDTGYFHGSGAINGGCQLGEGFNGLSAQNFAYNVIQSSQQWNYGTNDVTVIGDNVKLTTINRNNAWINQNYLSDNGFWGVVQTVRGGTKDSGLAPTAWAWAAHQMNASTPRSDYTGIEITKTENGISTGNYVGAAAIYSGGPVSDPSFTAVSAGSIKGLFDPTATTWQAVSQGSFMET